MHTDDAYNALLNALGLDREIKITERFLDEENFGNFVISFEKYGRRRTLINDRGQLTLSRGREPSTTIVQSIGEADERTLLEALQRRRERPDSRQ